jgi:mycothiol synthase
VDVLDLAQLDDARRADVTALLRRAEQHDGYPPLPEPQLRAVTGTGASGDGASLRIVLDGPGPAVRGCAVLSTADDGSTVVHLVVDPAARAATPGGDVTGPLIDEVLAVAGDAGPLHLWAMHAGPEDDARASRGGFAPERDLLQMRVPLPLGAAAIASAAPLVTRAFVPGRDDAAWLDTNNRAFDSHPEQGGWTEARLRERLAAPWVDLDGFLLADDPDGEGLIGSCWTKVHADHDPVLGEIYVIAVDPRHHGHGWGRSLAVAGLAHLAAAGVPVGMLYVDAANEAAVQLYRSLGFAVDHVDRSYRRSPLS